MSDPLDDERAIRDLLAAYCYCADGTDVDAFVDLFTEDGVFDRGQWGRSKGQNELRASKTPMTAGAIIKPRHMSSNEIVTIYGDTAVARSYVLVMNVALSPPAPLVVGCYEDQLVKIDGRWRFRSRVLQNTQSS